MHTEGVMGCVSVLGWSCEHYCLTTSVFEVGPHLLQWRNSMVTKPRNMARLGRVAEVLYSRNGVHKISAALCAYSSGEAVSYSYVFGTSALCAASGGLEMG